MAEAESGEPPSVWEVEGNREALQCPQCGHLDLLLQLDADARRLQYYSGPTDHDQKVDPPRSTLEAPSFVSDRTTLIHK